MGRAFKWGSLVFLAVAAFVTILATISDKTVSPTDRRAEEGRFEEFQAVQRAKRQVQAAIRDPGSAQFGRVDRLSNGMVCGYVNARNGFGGMTGMRAFMVGQQVGGLIMEERGRRSFFRLWDVQCVQQSRKDYAK